MRATVQSLARRTLSIRFLRGITLALAIPTTSLYAQAKRPAARAAAETTKAVPRGSARFREALRRGIAQRDRFVARMTALSSFVLMPFWEVAEYQDEQRFSSGTGNAFTYGPLVRVAASPFLGHFRKPKDFDASGPFGFLVALVDLTTPVHGVVIGAPYQGLKLTAAGKYCVYLAHAKGGSDAAWTAYVVRSANGTSCDRPDPSTPSLPVDYVKLGGPREDYLGVARFGEDTNDQPTIGVPCGDAICWITPTNAKEKDPAHKGKNAFLDGKMEGKVALWHDDQVLWMKDQAGKLTPWGRGTVTPVADLDSRTTDDYTADYVRVAWIWLADNPANTKYGQPVGGSKTWGMQQGLNLLELKYVGPDSWQARATPYKEDASAPSVVASTSSLIVNYKRHPDVWIPGSARFSWLLQDEGVWVPCDQGCCQVDADK
jgi:hypothetical protein